jgi:sulfur carrier protein ThiS
MRIRVKLFGTFQQRFSDYDKENGLIVEISDGARVKDLLAHLEISKSDGGLVAMEGIIADPEDELDDGSSVHILQLGHGG